MWNLIPHPTSTHTAYFYGPCYPKNKKFLKNVMMTSSSRFLGISYFWGRGVRQKYALWVLVGSRIKLHIQKALPSEIWVNTQGDMSKIRTKKVVLFMIPIPKFIFKNCLIGAPFLNFKAFWLANTWWHGICIIFGRLILNWNFL